MPVTHSKPAEIEQILETLSETLIYFSSVVETHQEDFLRKKAPDGGWSVAQNLAHLLACAEVWGDSIYAMLVIDSPTLENIHPRKWQKAARYQTLTCSQMIQKFSIDRQLLLDTLGKMLPKDWDRNAKIGNRLHTIFSQARRMAHHEAGHCDQIKELITQLN